MMKTSSSSAKIDIALIEAELEGIIDEEKLLDEEILSMVTTQRLFFFCFLSAHNFENHSTFWKLVWLLARIYIVGSLNGAPTYMNTE